jgi:hypothetical protein
VIFAHLAQTVSSLSADANSALESSISALESSISALEAAIRALDSSSIPWERSVWGFTALVVIGVAIEFWVIWREYDNELDAWALAHFGILWTLPRPSKLKFILEICSVVLVVTGVAGELWAGVRITSINGKLRGINAELQSKGDELRSKNDQLLALVTQQATQLRKEAEAEHLKRAEIEAKVAWRRLNDREQSDLAAKLGTFPPNSEGASFWYTAGDTESATFATDLANSLKMAHVVVSPPSGAMIMRESGKFGDPIKPLEYGVSVLPTKDDASQKLANRLIEELKQRGFDSFRRKDPPFRDSKFPMVEMFVWPRPEGPQGEYKLRAEREAKAKQTTNTQ